MWVLRVYCMSCIIFIDLLPYWSHKRCLLGFSLLTCVCNLKFALCYQMMWKINLSVLHKIIILTLCFSLLPAVIWYFQVLCRHLYISVLKPTERIIYFLIFFIEVDWLKLFFFDLVYSEKWRVDVDFIMVLLIVKM